MLNDKLCEELCQKIKKGDKAAEEALMKEVSPLVDRFIYVLNCKGVLSHMYEAGDARTDCLVTALDAARRFRPERGIKFETSLMMVFPAAVHAGLREHGASTAGLKNIPKDNWENV